MNTSDPVSQLGSLSSYSSDDSQLAHEDDPDEREAIAAVIGERGTVKIEWRNESLYDYLDESEYDADHDQDQDDFMGDQNLKDGEENDSITLQKCIRKYCQKEQLDETEMWYCSKCQKHVRAWKQFHLYKAPPILIIHLKRFSYTAQSYTHRRDKINSHVDFPLEGLDLTEFVPHCSDDEKPIYDCYAISNHFGGCGGGHYTAYILGDDGAWSYYDDSSIQENQDKAKVVSSAAYVLYYRRRDVPVGGQDEMIVDPRASSPMLVEDGNNDPVRSEDDLSSNGAQAGDLDDTMDTQSNGSSRTSADVSREPSVCPLFDDSDDGGVPAGVAIPNNVYTKDFPPQ
jgi:ubiquitin carboxyl-terminal hydrolase 4/11/15